MKQININERSGTRPPATKPGVSISPSPTRTSERIDADGNVIDPRTKRIIRPNTDK